jgi:hypothetical protein
LRFEHAFRIYCHGILAYFYNQSSPTAAQNISASFIVIALAFLSPLHHFNRVLAKFKRLFGFAPSVAATAASVSVRLQR